MLKKLLKALSIIIFIWSCNSESTDKNATSDDEVIMGESLDPEPETNPFDDGVVRELTSIAIAADMGAGWNLGNSLDTESVDETFWGNPLTTKAMVDAIAERGFKTLRLPVTWRFHQGAAPEYNVEESWLDRVEEICNYARANNMYVIINIHHDDEWIIPTYEQEEAVKDRLAKLWTQIANRFKDYSDYVIFETLNEPRHEGTPEEWSGGTAEGRDVVNTYHKTAVDAIRATGGNNALRHLLVSTYAASTVVEAMDDYIIPNNDDRVIVSLHSYFPFPFTLEGTESTWGTESDKTELEAELDKIAAKFVNNGRAVILGEWSSLNQNNLADRLEHAQFYAHEASIRGLVSVWWDNGNLSSMGDGLAIFDRNTLEWPFGAIADILVEETN